jgi:hypothetical protein
MHLRVFETVLIDFSFISNNEVLQNLALVIKRSDKSDEGKFIHVHLGLCGRNINV